MPDELDRQVNGVAGDGPVVPVGSQGIMAQRLTEARLEREGRALARRRRRLRAKRLRRGALLCAVLVLPFLLVRAIYQRPIKVVIESRVVRLPANRSLASAVIQAGVPIPRGDLMDVRGDVLRPGGGGPAIPFCDGKPVSYGEAVRKCRRVTFRRGTDVREPIESRAELVASLKSEEWRNPWKPQYFSGLASVAGIERVEVGALSGKVYLFEKSAAEPLEPPSTSEGYQPKRLALTFDDGPNGDTTRAIMVILNEYGAHGTFFLLGDCVGEHPDVVREAVEAGHEIGNHSWGHKLMTRLGPEAAVANIARAEKAINDAGAPRCRWFRPPYGATNAAVRRAILEAGYNIALWSCDTNDWQRPGAETIYRRIIAGAKPGASILLHDGGGNREQTIEAVRRAVPDLIAMGYELVTLSEMTSRGASSDGGMVLTSECGTWIARIPTDPIYVMVNGREITDPGPILMAGGTVLLPVPSILDALGANWEWDSAGQVVNITSVYGQFRFRLNSCLVRWNDREVSLNTPPVLYHGTPLLPAWALARAANARLDERRLPHTFHFVSLSP